MVSCVVRWLAVGWLLFGRLLGLHGYPAGRMQVLRAAEFDLLGWVVDVDVAVGVGGSPVG